jgi:hypothetical protein
LGRSIIVITLRERTTLISAAIAMMALAAAPDQVHAQSTFSHPIPLKIPRGANGMQPDLALVYS